MNTFVHPALLTALLQAGLLVTAAWPLFVLSQRRGSAARVSAAGRVVMVAALAVMACPLWNGWSFPTDVPFPQKAAASPALPQGSEAPASDALLRSTSEIQHPSAAAASLSGPPAGETKRLTFHPATALGLSAVWLAGAAFILFRWIAGLAARSSCLRHSREVGKADHWLKDAANGVRGWHRVSQVRRHSAEVTPCVWGVWKTTLLLPASAPLWPAEKLRLVLAHECAHLLRRDPLWQIISRFFLASLWFHPFAWSLIRRGQAADERAADDAVLRTLSDGPSYADLLVECARRFTLAPALKNTAAAMSCRKSGTLTRRVEAVLDNGADRRPAGFRVIALWCGIAFLITSAVSFAGPQVTTEPVESPEDPRPSAAQDELLPPEPDEPATETPATSPPAETEAAETEPSEETPAAETPLPASFAWKPVELDGREYLPASQVETFYQFKPAPDPPEIPSENIWFRSQRLVMRWTAGSPEIRINNIRIVLKYPIESSGNTVLISRWDLVNVVDALLRPKETEAGKATTVVIDPGHGGHDSGAIHESGSESVFVMDTALKLKTALERFGFKTVLTRTGDEHVPLSRRMEIAAAEPHALFISLHYNSHNDPSKHGIQTFFPNLNETEAPLTRASTALAVAVHSHCLILTRAADAGVGGAEFPVLRLYAKMPAILVECGFLSNPEEAAKIATESHRETIAQAIAEGVRKYRLAIHQRGN